MPLVTLSPEDTAKKDALMIELKALEKREEIVKMKLRQILNKL